MDSFKAEVGIPGFGKIGFGNDDGEDRAYSNFLRDIEYGRQKEFAQSGIQWRVADAKAAGVHPVWALGGGGAAYAPSPISVGSAGSGSHFSADMGQDVSRSAQATQSPEQRMMTELELDFLKMRNESARIDLEAKRRGNNAQVGPGMPSNIPGDMFQGDWSVTEPAKRVSHDFESPSTTASASSPFWEKFTIDDKGSTIWLPSGGKGTATESLEALSESWPMMYSVVSENMRRDPELVYKLRHLWPGGEMAAYVARMLDQGMQAVLNARKRSHAAKEIARQWWERHRSDRAKERGLK